MTTPSIFESFNARTLEPDQVAKTFVPPPQFERLIRNTHCQLIGPRGSGKTTLLKMLTPSALDAWTSPNADDYRQRIGFVGVFIAADNSWKTQLDSITNDKSIAEPHGRVLASAAFSTHVLMALVKAIEYRTQGTTAGELQTFRGVSWTREQETAFVRQVSNGWALPVTISTCAALRAALAVRMNDIGVILSKERVLGDTGRAERLASFDYLHGHFVHKVVLGIEVFELVSGTAGEKWALLFDELELVPSWIRIDLLQSLRSVDQRLLFKLSMSPFSEDAPLVRTPIGPASSEDYDEISLSYAHKDDGLRFCEALFDSMVHERGKPELKPIDVLGRSRQDSSRAEWSHTGSAYAPGSPLQVQFARLLKSDPTFRQYVENRNLDLQELHLLRDSQRAADIRKVTPIVAVRAAFRETPGKRTRRGIDRQTRSRKNPKIYAGAASMFAMTEANPRWFIGLLQPLLDEYVKLPQHRRTVDAAKQNRQVERACARFVNLLATIPCQPYDASQPRGVMGVIDAVASYLFREVVLGKFDPDAAGSFRVDADAPHELVAALGQALNAGAIVYVPGRPDEPTVETLRGLRFRLSYLLCPKYRLPLRLGRPVGLGFMLKSTRSMPLFPAKGSTL